MFTKIVSRRILATLFLSLMLAFNAVSVWAGAGNGEGGTPPGSGTISDPAVLNIGTSYTGSISPAGSVFYKFTTGNQAFQHIVSLGTLSSNYIWTLYSDPDYSTIVKGCSGYGYDFSCTTAKLNPRTTYYLRLNEMSAANDSYHIKVDVIIGSEGSYSEPVNLTVGTPYLGAVKKKSSVNGKSYYKFTTTNASYHTISLSGATTDLKWELNSHNSGLYPEVIDCDVVWDRGDESCSTTFLQANTTYYLIVENAGAIGTFFNINISEGGEPQPIGVDEGSMISPVALTVDQAHTGTAAAGGTSYYKFTTGNEVATHLIRINRKSTRQEVQLYLDSGFSVLEERCYIDFNNFSDGKCPITFLDANTTYYFSLRNMVDVGDIYSISVLKNTPRSPDSEGTTITPVKLTVDTLHAGKVGAWDQSYYKFTAPQAKPYRISLSGNNYRLHWVTKLDWDRLFGETICHADGSQNGECVTGRFDAGQTVYFYVWNDDEFNADTYNLLIQVEEGLSEGTQNTPIALTPGRPHSGSVEAETTSYYEFTTGAEPLIYTLGLTGLTSDLEWRLKKNGDYNDMYSCSRYYDTRDEICTPPPLEPNSTYRIAVNDRGNLLSTYTLNVSVGVPPTTLKPGQVFSETVDGNTNKKYYRFTTGANASTDYTITINGASHEPSWLLFPNPLFTIGTYIRHCGNTYFQQLAVSCTVTGLQPNTTYYIQAYSSKNYAVSSSYNILVNEGGGNEGSIDSPINLALPASHIGDVADDGHSYYQFTTADGGPKEHLISLTGLSSDLIWLLYRDAAYTDFIMSCNGRGLGDEICLTTESLKAGTTYYLAVGNIYSHSSSYQLDIAAQKKGGGNK